VKLCFIIHDVTLCAGTERAQANLANALAARGESPSIWSCYGHGRPSGFQLSNHVMVKHGRQRPLPWFLDYPWLMCSFAFFVIRSRPDWIICTDTNRLIVALLAAFVPGVRLAVWEHYAVSHSVTKARGRLARRLAAALASATVMLAERDADLYTKLYAPSGPVTVIPNIVSPPVLKIVPRRQEILAMGRLVPQKGFDLLLQAWARVIHRLPGWNLRIVGEGEMRGQLLQQICNLGIEDHVTLAPFVQNPFPLFRECGIFILSSRFEGLPFVLIEAMTQGAPCISFNCPNGPSELIRDRINGLLIPPEQVQALADAIVELGEDRNLRQKLGDAALSIAASCSEAHVAARWQEVLSL
jgi:glycosyltransferase involved in cell wall biosynthesis